MKAEISTQTDHDSRPINRRNFLTGTSASVVAFTILSPQLVRGADANGKINLGLVGCGGRGTWIADLFRKHSGYNVAAVADYFPDRANQAGEKLGVPAERRYTGLAGYERMLATGIDAVVVQSPPYFHPMHCEGAVNAGKHVYLAKPAAVDVPGCLKISELGAKASSKKLCFLIDFQTRANKWYQEAVQRVHQGELGKIISVEAEYQCDLMFEGLDQQVRKDPNNPEVRLRAWAIDRALSGDVITEQNIHALDVASWMLNAEPVKAYGTGGRTREFIGNCWDRFAVIFYYPNDVFVSFNSRQSGFGYDDIMCRVYGTQGTVDTHYGGKVTVRAKDVRSSNDTGNLYSDGAITNIATFHDDVTQGRCGNASVATSIRSNLTTILGRTAAYKGGLVTWEEMMRSKEKLTADLKGLQA
jgi:myo-inositol 2-dehydrogenase / D-chiro-inositol 1-dehydrogenase